MGSQDEHIHTYLPTLVFFIEFRIFLIMISNSPHYLILIAWMCAVSDLENTAGILVVPLALHLEITDWFVLF